MATNNTQSLQAEEIARLVRIVIVPKIIRPFELPKKVTKVARQSVQRQIVNHLTELYENARC